MKTHHFFKEKKNKEFIYKRINLRVLSTKFHFGLLRLYQTTTKNASI